MLIVFPNPFFGRFMAEQAVGQRCDIGLLEYQLLLPRYFSHENSRKHA